MIYPIKSFTEISINYTRSSPGKKTPEDMCSKLKKISDSDSRPTFQQTMLEREY